MSDPIVVDMGTTSPIVTPVAGGGTGIPGLPGPEGDSAYEVAVENGFEGTVEEWLESLVGPEGPQGEPGQDGAPGEPGQDGEDGHSPVITWDDTTIVVDGTPGPDLQGSQGEPGEKGDKGEPGTPGADGADGEKGEKGDPGTPGSPGADGSDGADGEDGDSAYEIWLAAGNTGTEQDFLDSLVGPKGDPGTDGSDGQDGEKGDPGTDGSDGQDGAAASVSVGTTTTGAPGTQASVTNTGTSSAAVLAFTIPQGEKGEPGEKGDQGDPGTAPADVVTSETITEIVALTQAAYDALTPDPTTFYIITDA